MIPAHSIQENCAACQATGSEQKSNNSFNRTRLDKERCAFTESCPNTSSEFIPEKRVKLPVVKLHKLIRKMAYTFL